MKPAAEDDPMELVAVALAEGDSDQMAECLIEEFLLIGWSERQLMTLFTRPQFRATHLIYRERGEAHVRDLIRRVGETWRPVATTTAKGDAGNA
jgi:hypothetical protein